MNLRIFLPLLCSILIAGLPLQASVTLNITAGTLLKADGTTAMPDGMLLQVIVSNTTSFLSPTAGSFTGNDPNETVVASYDLESSRGGQPGADASTFVLTLSGNVVQGDQILLRWFPTLLASQHPLASLGSPGAETTYGQYRTDSIADGSSSGWFVPADGSPPADLNFLTQTASGPEPNSAGIASNTIAVPEPSSLLPLSLIFFGGGLVARRRRS